MKALLESLQPGEKDWELAQAIDPARLPAHIAIIMDGNGRWAGRRRLPRVAGHKAGIGPVRTTVETCARLGVKVLTLYAFSVENWKRPRAEVETLWRLLRYYLKQELPDLQKNDIRLQAIGRLDALPPQVRRELDSAVEATVRQSRPAGEPGDQLRRPRGDRGRRQCHSRNGAPGGQPRHAEDRRGPDRHQPLHRRPVPIPTC